MGKAKIDFDSLPWEEQVTGARSKAVARAGRRVSLVEFTDQFAEPEWCVKGHAGYVIEGEMELTFDVETERLAAGDAIFINGGEQERHKARVIGPFVRLLLVEDI